MHRTTKEIDEDMSDQDMDILENLYDVLMLIENNQLAAAVNRGLVGDKP